MHEEIVGIIREVCGKDIDEDMSLFGDLQMDSVEMIELVLRIEEKYLFDFESYDELMNILQRIRGTKECGILISIKTRLQ